MTFQYFFFLHCNLYPFLPPLQWSLWWWWPHQQLSSSSSPINQPKHHNNPSKNLPSTLHNIKHKNTQACFHSLAPNFHPKALIYWTTVSPSKTSSPRVWYSVLIVLYYLRDPMHLPTVKQVFGAILGELLSIWKFYFSS